MGTIKAASTAVNFPEPERLILKPGWEQELADHIREGVYL
jgi:hypothetical protein